MCFATGWLSGQPTPGHAGLCATAARWALEPAVRSNRFATTAPLGCSGRARAAKGTRPMKVLVVTNMYPTAAEPWFGSFVRDQVEDLRALGLDLELLSFEGRHHATEYVRAARRVRQLTRTGR